MSTTLPTPDEYLAKITRIRDALLTLAITQPWVMAEDDITVIRERLKKRMELGNYAQGQTALREARAIFRDHAAWLAFREKQMLKPK